MKKKLLSILSILALSVSILNPATAFADEVSTDLILINHGVPSEIVAIMPEEQKLELVNADDFTYCGSNTIVDEINENTQGGKGMSTQGTISSSQLSLTGYGFMYTSGGKKLAQVSAYYNWVQNPGWFLTDQIGITWDSSYYAPVDQGQWIVCQHQDLNGTNLTQTTSYDLLDISNSGFIIDVDMVGNHTNFGTATAKLQLKSGASEPTNSQFYYKYAHISIVPTIGLSLNTSVTGGIAVSASVNVESLASSTTFQR